nr:terminase small subunit [uncultured Selenomonas sp.]
MKLTPKQMRFVDEYLVDFNATQAAIRAGYSPKTAAAAAARLLRNVNIQAEIARRQKDLQRRTEISQDRVVKELARIAFADASDYACIETYMYENKDGTLSPLQAVSPKDTGVLSDDQRAAIAGIKQGANGIEIKLHDKIKALELLGRHIGMFNDKLSLSGSDGGPLTFRWEGGT